MQKLSDGQFILTGELEPGRTVNIDPLLQEAQEMKPYVAAANITDNPGSFVAMNGLAAATLVKERTGIEVIYQLTCRDQNRMGLASSLLGAAAVGINNVLTLTGDHTALGDVPATKPVFDLDSAQLLDLAREMVDKKSIYGVPIEETDIVAPHFHLGIGANPNTDQPEIELMKIDRKIKLGAEFIQTQVVFDLEKTESFFRELKKFGVPVLVGIFPMKNYNTAKDFDTLIPGVNVPKEILNQFKEIKDNGMPKETKHAAYDQINVNMIQPMLAELKKKGYAAGAHITAVHYTRIFPKLLN